MKIDKANDSKQSGMIESVDSNDQSKSSLIEGNDRERSLSRAQESAQGIRRLGGGTRSDVSSRLGPVNYQCRDRGRGKSDDLRRERREGQDERDPRGGDQRLHNAGFRRNPPERDRARDTQDRFPRDRRQDRNERGRVESDVDIRNNIRVDEEYLSKRAGAKDSDDPILDRVRRFQPEDNTLNPGVDPMLSERERRFGNDGKDRRSRPSDEEQEHKDCDEPRGDREVKDESNMLASERERKRAERIERFEKDFPADLKMDDSRGDDEDAVQLKRKSRSPLQPYRPPIALMSKKAAAVQDKGRLASQVSGRPREGSVLDRLGMPPPGDIAASTQVILFPLFKLQAMRNRSLET